MDGWRHLIPLPVMVLRWPLARKRLYRGYLKGVGGECGGGGCLASAFPRMQPLTTDPRTSPPSSPPPSST
jgi:hypothetical protein